MTQKQLLTWTAIVLGLVIAVTIYSETVPQTQTVLKSYFVTGAIPTETNYDELIDTMFWYIGWTYTNALNAQAYASNVAAQASLEAHCYVAFTNAGTGWGGSGPKGGVAESNACYFIPPIGVGYESVHGGPWTNFFSIPTTSTNYIVMFVANGQTNYMEPVYRTTNYVAGYWYNSSSTYAPDGMLIFGQ